MRWVEVAVLLVLVAIGCATTEPRYQKRSMRVPGPCHTRCEPGDMSTCNTECETKEIELPSCEDECKSSLGAEHERCVEECLHPQKM